MGRPRQPIIDTSQPQPNAEAEQPLTEHLIELRNRLIICVIAFAIPLIPLFIFIKPIYAAMLNPLYFGDIPEGAIKTINTGIVSPTATPIKIIMVLSIIIAVPVILHQLWRFIAPGLYKNEQRFAMPLLASSIGLFYSGMAFAYFVLVPAILNFSYYFGDMLNQGWQPEVSEYVSFMVTQFLLVGAAFETPVATFLMVKTGITSVAALKKARPYVLVAVLIIGMLLTPPDVFSQLLLAVPMYTLFELGILVSWLFVERKAKQTTTTE